jgi:hypothetical protein
MFKMKRHCKRWMLGFALGGLLACSPADNWRVVSADVGPLQLWLPCKPERAQRPIVLVNQHGRALHMLSCRANGVVFALSHLQLDPQDDVPTLVRSWQRATLSTLKADVGATRPWMAEPAGGLQVRLAWRVAGAPNESMPMQALIFQVDSHLYQLATYGAASQAQWAQLLEGLKWH